MGFFDVVLLLGGLILITVFPNSFFVRVVYVYVVCAVCMCVDVEQADGKRPVVKEPPCTMMQGKCNSNSSRRLVKNLFTAPRPTHYTINQGIKTLTFALD